jgi:hypothetical protein
MAELLRELVASVPAEQIRPRAASIMRQIERHRVGEARMTSRGCAATHRVRPKSNSGVGHVVPA